MNAVEIEEVISALAERRFDAAEFPFAFLAAFGNKDTTIKRLRSRDGNYSDCGGVLQRNAHIAVASDGEVGKALAALKTSSATAKHKVQFIIATDGAWFEAARSQALEPQENRRNLEDDAPRLASVDDLGRSRACEIIAFQPQLLQQGIRRL